MKRLNCSRFAYVVGMLLVMGFCETAWAGTTAVAEEPSLVGPWRAFMMKNQGERPSRDDVKRLLLRFSDKTVEVRVGNTLVAQTPCTIDESADPATIDINFDGEKTLGIFKIRKGRLTIHANNPEKGRPKDFNAKSDVSLVLSRADRDWTYVHIMDADGGNQRILVNHPEFTGVGSPEWSHDGKKLAYDGWRKVYGEGSQLAHSLICNADGSDVKDLGIAAMPTWSPDGKKIGFSNYDPRGVWIMNADGTERTMIDPEGWAIEWCPKGNKVAYTVYNSGSANVRVRDLKTDKCHDLLDGRFSTVYWGMNWSPDGQWIAFVGRLSENGQLRLAIVHVDGHNKDFRILMPNSKMKSMKLGRNPSWSPDSKQVLAAISIPKNASRALYKIDIDHPEQALPIPGQREDRAYGGPAWSPDGKKIIFLGRKDR